MNFIVSLKSVQHFTILMNLKLIENAIDTNDNLDIHRCLMNERSMIGNNV